MEQTPPPGFALRSPRYRIEPSDMIEILFRFTPEFNQVVTVQPDGFIPLQAAGELQVAGMIVDEVPKAIADRYSTLLRAPVVTVILKEFHKPYFIVGGAVAKPGRFDLRGEVTMTDAIAIAGGFNPGAKPSEALLFRRVSRDLAEVKRINLKNTFNGRLREDVVLQPRDSVYVPESKFGKIQRFMQISGLGLLFNPIP